MAVRAGKLVVVQPLPLVPTGSVVVADGVSLLEDEEGAGTVFIWGQATWTWDGSDLGARRLAAVQLVNSGAASQRQVAVAFGANETTVWRWRSDYKAGGLVQLLPQRKGPKRPSKLTDEKRAEIVQLRSSGLTKPEVAARTGLSTQSVRRATLGIALVPSADPEVGSPTSATPSNNLVPLNPPIERTGEREAARRGMLDEAAPVICKGGSLPFVGRRLPGHPARSRGDRALGCDRLGLRLRSTGGGSQASGLLRPAIARAVRGVLLAPGRAQS